MNYLFIILSYLHLLVVSNSTNPKLCVDCKFFKKDLLGDRFGTCSLFKKYEISDDSFLVDGIVRGKSVKYHYCSTARLDDCMCGKDGNLYEKNNNLILLPNPLLPSLPLRLPLLPLCPLNKYIENIFKPLDN